MQLEQQETFTIHGPQLEVLGRVESKLPPPARKRPVAALALAVLALASVLGVGGGRLRALHDSTARIYSAAQDEYGHGIQSDLADQADAAASLIRVAGGVLGEQDADVQAARQALDAWNETADPDRPAVQYERNNTLAGAVEVLYTAASDEADARAKGQLQDLHDAGCDLVTITQYLRPSLRHHPVDRWVKPEEFVELSDAAEEIGFLGVMSGPLVRSSYRAGRLWGQAMTRRGMEIPAALAHLAEPTTSRQEAASLLARAPH